MKAVLDRFMKVKQSERRRERGLEMGVSAALTKSICIVSIAQLRQCCMGIKSNASVIFTEIKKRILKSDIFSSTANLLKAHFLNIEPAVIFTPVDIFFSRSLKNYVTTIKLNTAVTMMPN